MKFIPSRRFFRVYKRVLHGPDGSPYLIRWALHLPRGYAIYLHKMVREDFGRELHDHPWRFLTLILKGGYLEEYRKPGDPVRLPFSGRMATPRVRVNVPGMIRLNPAHHMHRVFSLCGRGPCWTLVLRGRSKREWGFETDCGWMPHDKYIGRLFNGDAICEDD